MHATPVTPHDPSGTDRYEIRVRGHLSDRWAASFPGLSLRRDPDGTTVLIGEHVDQAALHGFLRRIRDLGLPLLAVTRAANADDAATAGEEAGP